MKFRIILFFWLIIAGWPVMAETGPGTIGGQIIDSLTRTPVEYATVILKKLDNGQLVTGTVTDSTGLFRLEDIPLGLYKLELSLVGYETKKIGQVKIESKNHHLELGTVQLLQSSIMMEGVEITAEKTMMITKIDRKVFNVQADIQAQTGTVNDVLRKIPSISVDIDGGISLRGSGSVTLLINGRPSVLATSANFDQMPASQVDRIEVITNPSAKYKPDGTGGIINIILKKEKKPGANTTLSLNAGNNDRFNSNLLVNYNTGKLNLYGGYGYRQDYRWRSVSLKSKTIDTASGTSLWLDQQSDGDAKPLSHLMQAGLEYEIGKNDFISLSGTANLRSVNRDDTTWNFYRNTVLDPVEEYTRHHFGDEAENSIGLNAGYEHFFNRETEHKLNLDLEFERDAEKEDDQYRNEYVLPVLPHEITRSLANNREQNLNIAASYNRPLSEKSVLEAGYEGNIQVADQDQSISAWEPDTQTWNPDPEQGNRFYGVQTVHALYSTYSLEWRNFRMMAGLRAEQTFLNLEFRTLNTTSTPDYFGLYPTLHMGILNGDNEWQLNYSRRINRPDAEDMNPVPEYRDPRNYFVGNPDLEPEEIHSVEFGYTFRNEKLSLVPTLFYRYRYNGFSMYNYTVNDTILVSTLANFANDQSAGLDISGTIAFHEKINLNLSNSAFYSELDASNIGYENKKTAFSWSSKMNITANLTKTSMFQVNSQFRSRMLTAQGTRKPSWWINFGFRQDLWKKKVSLLLTVSDAFDSMRMNSTVDTPVLMQESVRRRDGRAVYAGLVINLGTNGKKQKESKFEFDNGMDQ